MAFVDSFYFVLCIILMLVMVCRFLFAYVFVEDIRRVYRDDRIRSFLMHSIQGRSEHSSSIVHRSARRLCRRSSPGCCVDDFVVVVITNDPVFRVRVFLFAIFRTT